MLRERRGDLTVNLGMMGVFFGVYALIFVLGVVGNLCVVFAVGTRPDLRSIRNLFIVSLSSSDIGVCFTSVLITPISTFYTNWIFGAAFCRILPVLQARLT